MRVPTQEPCPLCFPEKLAEARVGSRGYGLAFEDWLEGPAALKQSRVLNCLQSQQPGFHCHLRKRPTLACWIMKSGDLRATSAATSPIY